MMKMFIARRKQVFAHTAFMEKLHGILSRTNLNEAIVTRRNAVHEIKELCGEYGLQAPVFFEFNSDLTEFKRIAWYADESSTWGVVVNAPRRDQHDEPLEASLVQFPHYYQKKFTATHILTVAFHDLRNVITFAMNHHVVDRRRAPEIERVL